MISELDIYRAAHLMMHAHGGNAELEAARYADRMLKRGKPKRGAHLVQNMADDRRDAPGTDRPTTLTRKAG